jgi:hypothetical protein
MTLEQQLNQAKDAAAVAADRANKAEASAATKDTTIAALEKDKTELNAKVAALETERTELNAKLETSNKTISDLNAKVEETKKTVDTEAGKKSAATLAALGVAPVADAPEAGTNSTDLWAQYNALPDAKAKREFYLAHQKEM